MGVRSEAAAEKVGVSATGSDQVGVSLPGAPAGKVPGTRSTLSDAACRAASPREKPYKLGDSGGLFLLVQPGGGKLWRLKYRHGGKEKLLSLGAYTPSGGGIGAGVSLKEARELRDAAKRQLREGIDPSAARRDAKEDAKRSADNTLKSVAAEWIAKQSPAWSKPHTARVRTFLAAEVFPVLGHVPIATITAPDLLRRIEVIEARGAFETARKVRQFCGQLWRYAMRTRPEVQGNPADALRGALTRHQSEPYRHMKADDVGPFLVRLRQYGSHTTGAALRLAMLTACRPGEIRGARWQEFDLSTPGAELWSIPAERMKGRRRHLVPLSRQAVETLRTLEPLSRTAPDALLFRGLNDPKQPISDATLLSALRRLKTDSTAHGFRHLFSTVCNERLMAPAEIIERCLAHEQTDKVRATYNRAEHLEARRALLQAWADLLDKEEATSAAR